jgi:uncharacterized protein (DUF2062 family)
MMKPFKINRNSWHYKLNKNFFNECQYSMEYNWEPRHNNFCAYWRATMFRMLFAAILTAGLGGMFTVLGVAVYNDPLAVASVVGGVLGLIATMVGIAFILQFFSNRKKAKADLPDSLFMQKYKAHKSKICPGVEYE